MWPWPLSWPFDLKTGQRVTPDMGNIQTMFGFPFWFSYRHGMCRQTKRDGVQYLHSGTADSYMEGYTTWMQKSGFGHPGTYPKKPSGFFGRAHLKNPVKKPPILILYLTFIFSHQLDICMQITMSAMHNTNRMLNTTVWTQFTCY